MFEVIHGGNSIPPKIWLRATDIAAEYARCGEAFVSAGRPTDGPVADLFSQAEAEYSQMANAIWFAKWEKWQREEWERIFRADDSVSSPRKTASWRSADLQGENHRSNRRIRAVESFSNAADCNSMIEQQKK